MALRKKRGGSRGCGSGPHIAAVQKCLLYVWAHLEHVPSLALGRDCSQVVVDKLNKSRKTSMVRWEELNSSSAPIEDDGTMSGMYPTLHHLCVELSSKLLCHRLDGVTKGEVDVLLHHSQALDIWCLGKITCGQDLL